VVLVQRKLAWSPDDTGAPWSSVDVTVNGPEGKNDGGLESPDIVVENAGKLLAHVRQNCPRFRPRSLLVFQAPSFSVFLILRQTAFFARNGLDLRI
jgi:hypothetical protein